MVGRYSKYGVIRLRERIIIYIFRHYAGEVIYCAINIYIYMRESRIIISIGHELVSDIISIVVWGG